MAPVSARARSPTAATQSRRTVEQLRQQGLDCPVVGGAGTGTFELEGRERRPTPKSSAAPTVSWDADYARNTDAPGFSQALFVQATVMSTAQPGIAVVDAGLKALSTDSGMPLVWQRPGLALRRCLGRARQADLRTRQ